MMRMRVPLLICACMSVLLPMCQQNEGPMAAGSILAVDTEADSMLQRARASMDKGQYRVARAILKDLVNNHPFAPCIAEAQLALGDVYAKLDDFREAYKRYGKVVEEHQGSPLYREALNRQLAMATSAADGTLRVPVFGGLWSADMESAVVKRWLGDIIKNAPYNEMSATAMSVLGRYLLKRDEQEAACAVFSQLAENYPDSSYAPEAQLLVAQIWATSRTRGNNNNLVNLQKAQEAYEEFTLRFPDHPDAKKAKSEALNMKRLLVQQQLGVGRYYLERSHEYQSAVFCLEDVIRQESVNPEAAAEARKLLPRARQLMSGSTR